MYNDSIIKDTIDMKQIVDFFEGFPIFTQFHLLFTEKYKSLKYMNQLERFPFHMIKRIDRGTIISNC